MPSNKNFHHRQSIRLLGCDYGIPGMYFVTICTKSREYLFGDVVDGEMRLSEFGRIVRDEWLNTSVVRKNVAIDEFVVMPNHVHGIIVITNIVGIDCINPNDNGDTGIDINQSLQRDNWRDNRNIIHEYGPQSNNLFAIIRGFKGKTTKLINIARNNEEAGSIWQSRFHDHVIRNDKSLNKIRQYIKNNPFNWQNDLENSKFNHLKEKGNVVGIDCINPDGNGDMDIVCEQYQW